jgi:DNA-binding response OmpR family regulator
MQKRILIVEDDRALARVMRDNLTFEGFHVETTGEGNAAVGLARSFAPDLILLDLTLPDRDGLELCGVIREHGQIPIIIVTARGQKSDKLRGLNLGADDYVTKPFEMDELLARVRAVLRRTRTAVDGLTLGRVSINFRSLTATSEGTELHLTHREFEVLRYLAERQERVVHRDELLREIWGYIDAPSTRSVDHAIARLRKKIENDPPHPQFIKTVHGGGYCLTVSGSHPGS